MKMGLRTEDKISVILRKINKSLLVYSSKYFITFLMIK